MEFSDVIKFTELSKLLENVSITKLLKKKEEFFRNFFKTLFEFRQKFQADHPDKNSSLLPIMRLILSQEEKERAYGLQELTIRKLFIKVIGLGQNTPDYNKIDKCSEDELPNRIYEVLKTRISGDGSLSVYDVDSILQSFSENQKSTFQESEMRKLFLKSSATDLKWICKMILKRMNLTIGTVRILRILHPKAPDFFSKFNHLSRVIDVLDSGDIDKIDLHAVEVFTPIRTMLCEKISSASNKDFLTSQHKSFYQETKMDGERFQLHVKDGTFQYFSRNGHDFTAGFDEILTPLIKFSAVVKSLILDGEMMVYHKDERRYHPKGETAVDVKHIKSTNSQFRPCYCAFDVLYYNGVNFMTRPYHERSNLLSQLFEDREGILVKTKPVRIRDLDHMVELFNRAIEHDEEGIVLKESNSHYKPGDRGGGWYKVKPDYFDGDLVKDFDCVIIGGFYENSYTKNFIKKFMVGAIDKNEDGNFDFHAIGEVHSGLTMQQRQELDARLKEIANPHAGENEVKCEKGKIFFGLNKPDVWFEPQRSLILEIRASELVRTSEQKTPYTLRFPRINEIRKDKFWDESCTLKEFLDLCKENDGKVKKLAMRNVQTNDMISPARKRKVAESRQDMIKKLQVTRGDFEDTKIYDNVLEGKEFCVMALTDQDPQEVEIKKLIFSHGGKIVQHPREHKTFAIVCSRVTHTVNIYIKKATINVIKTSWIVDNLKPEILSQLPTLRPKFDLHYITDQLMNEEVNREYDEFGDSWHKNIENIEEFEKLLDMNKNLQQIDDEKIAELEQELEGFHGVRNFNFFRTFQGSFVEIENPNLAMDFSKNIFKLRKGKITEIRDHKAGNFIICDRDEDFNKIHEILMKNLIDHKTSKLIDYRWIMDSSDAEKLLDVTLYRIAIE